MSTSATALVALCSEDDTARFGAALAAALGPGDLVVLSGPLGAGKTALTKAVAATLGVTEVVTSPTFTLLRSYPTAAGFELVHADLYRLEHRREVEDLGLPEMLDAGAAALVEWGERALDVLPPQRLTVTLEVTSPTARSARLEACGPRWVAALGGLTAGGGA